MTIGQSTSDDNWSEHNQKENIKTKMQKTKKVYYKIFNIYQRTPKANSIYAIYNFTTV